MLKRPVAGIEGGPAAQWALSRLAQLTRHSGLANPRTRFDGPVIVEGVERLLDGNRRINTWLARGDLSPRDVHIHTIDGTAKFVELPVIA